MVVIANGQISPHARQSAVVVPKLGHVLAQTQYLIILVKIVHGLEYQLRHWSAIHNHVQVRINEYLIQSILFFPKHEVFNWITVVILLVSFIFYWVHPVCYEIIFIWVYPRSSIL
jgi:hypothetical protein